MIALRRMIADYRDGAGCNRRIDKTRAVDLVAGKWKNRSPGFTARLSHGEAGDFECLGPGIDRGVIAEQVAEFHYIPVWLA